MSATWLSWSEATPRAGFQGIDYLSLELITNSGHPTSARLTVHLREAWSGSLFSPEHFALRGAEGREPPWSVVDQDGTAKTVVLAFSAIDPPVEYTLELLSGFNLAVDPFFREKTFTFAIDCERGDCRPDAEVAVLPSAPRPAVDLLAKDFEGLLTMFSEWVKVHNASWADLAPASLERVLVDLLAHQGDMLSYYQDRVAAEAFLDTATQRYSLRQHATLLGTTLFDGAAAETLLAFSGGSGGGKDSSKDDGPGGNTDGNNNNNDGNNNDGNNDGNNNDGDGGSVVVGTEVTTNPGGGERPVVFHVTESVPMPGDLGMLPLAAWPGAQDATIPAGATEVLLWGSVQSLNPGRRLCFVKGTMQGPIRAAHVVTVTDWRTESLAGWVAWPQSGSGTGGTGGTGSSTAPVPVTRVMFDPPLPEAMAPWMGEFMLLGNLATARFGALQTDRISLVARTLMALRGDAIIERGENGGRPILRAVKLSQSPVLFREERDARGVARGVPEVEVSMGPTGTGWFWTRVEHLHDSRSFDPHYVAHLDEDGALWLEFGDGVRGQAVVLRADDEDPTMSGPTGELVVRYRVGDPVDGNLGAGTLVRFAPTSPDVPAPPSNTSVINVLPATGGRRLEPMDVARLRIPASLRHGPLERAATLDDYRRAALIPGVARAVARALGGPFNTVLVLVDPEGQSALPDTLRDAVQARLDALRMAGREVVARAPEYVPLEVRVALCVAPGANPQKVKAAVLAALRPGRDDAGYFSPDRLSFGQSLEVGELLAFVQAIPGVRSVTALRFRKLRSPDPTPVVPFLGFGTTEIPRLDADPSRPENGTLAVKVVGIDPELHEHDFVIEERP